MQRKSHHKNYTKSLYMSGLWFEVVSVASGVLVSVCEVPLRVFMTMTISAAVADFGGRR